MNGFKWDPDNPRLKKPAIIVYDGWLGFPPSAKNSARGRRRVRVWQDARNHKALIARLDRRAAKTSILVMDNEWDSVPADQALGWLSNWHNQRKITDDEYAAGIAAVGRAAATPAYKKGAKWLASKRGWVPLK